MKAIRHVIKHGSLLVILAASLSNCGFVTTPLALASAEVASSTVKAADYGLIKGKQAANYLHQQGVEGTKVTIELVESVVDDLDTVFRSEPRPASDSTAPED